MVRVSEPGQDCAKPLQFIVANTFLFLCFRTKPEVVIHQRRNLYYELIMYLILSLS